MLKIRLIVLSLILIISAVSVNSVSNPTVEGYVLNTDDGKPFVGVTVDIFLSSDHSTPAASCVTDNRGYYSTTLASNENYDLYVRLGKKNPTQTVHLGGGEIREVNFKLTMESISESGFQEDHGIWMVLIVAIVILIVILVDQVFLRRGRAIRELERERDELESRLRGEVITEPEKEDELTALMKEKDKVQYMINMCRLKYHKRALDEESFREIVRDYQKRLIEIEAHIKELGVKGE